MSAADLRLVRASLVAVWLVTAIVSLTGLRGASAALLQQGGVAPGPVADALVVAAAALDLALGLALWLRPGRASALAALAGMASMTFVATLMLPALWLDPLGPLLKNLPIAAMLWLLARKTR